MKINLSQLTFLALQLNMMIDRGHSEPIETVEDRIEHGTVFGFLREHYRGEIDLSLFDAEHERPVVEAWQALESAYAGREARKWGVERNGLCLLLAWTVELIQQREIWK